MPRLTDLLRVVCLIPRSLQLFGSAGPVDMAPEKGAAVAHIEVVGSMNMDLVTLTERVPGPGETLKASSFSTGFGGKGANQAVAAARLLKQDGSAEPEAGIIVSMTGAVGDDQFGKEFVTQLRDVERIDVEGVIVKKGLSTGTACILVEEATGENRILITEGANRAFSTEAASKLKPVKGGERHFVVLQMEVPLPSLLACIEQAKAMGKEVVLNPAPATPLPEEVFTGLDHLIMNESEAAILANIPEPNDQTSITAAAKDFFEKGVKNVIITRGAKGAYYFNKDVLDDAGSFVNAEKVNAVDTTAAGDTWIGAYVVHLARHGSDRVGEAIKYANIAASKSVTKAGAQISMPYASEV